MRPQTCISVEALSLVERGTVPCSVLEPWTNAEERVHLVTTDSPDSECIVVNFTEADHDALRGTLFLAIYLGIWLISIFLPPLTLVLAACGFYIAAGCLGVIMALCFIIPTKPSQKFRQVARSHLGKYFQQCSIRFEEVPDPDTPTILCISPHGIISLSWAYCYLTDELHHLRWCFSPLLRLSPLFRVLTQLTGFPSDVRKATVIKHMRNNESIALIPGGWHEASIHSHQVDRIYIKKRQGFIKYALEYGYSITPTYAFGERTTFRNAQGCYSFRFWLNKFGILGILPIGRFDCPLLPSPTFLHTVIGKPILFPHIPHPTTEDVDFWHQAYMDEMSSLFDRYKVKFYGPEAVDNILELW